MGGSNEAPIDQGEAFEHYTKWACVYAYSVTSVISDSLEPHGL